MKKALMMALALVLVVALTIGGTLAYLTDRDSKTNVFTVGDVRIELNEDFDQGATLIPGVDIEKAATVKNVGKNDAWVWVKIAIPSALDNDDASKNVIHFNFSKDSVAPGLWNWDGYKYDVVDINDDGVNYNVYTVKYETALKPTETTAQPVMYKVYMDYHIDIDTNGDWHHVENGVVTDLDWNTEDDGAPVMYVSAYAMQKEGFDDVDAAIAGYNAQWGDKGDEYAPIPTIAASAEELQDALTTGGTIYLKENVEGGATIAQGADVDMNLKDNTLTGTVTNNGDLTISGGTIAANGDQAIYNEGNAELKDVTVTMTGSDGYIANSRTVDSVTIYENVTATSTGGGVNVWEGEAIFKSGTITTNSTSTSARHMFYVANGAKLTIEDGEFIFSPTNLTRKGSYICAHVNAEVIVNGGTFHKPSTRTAPIQEIDGGTVTIYGGTFQFDPSAFVADGYEAVENSGWWTVSAK